MRKIILFALVFLIMLSATAYGAYTGTDINNSMEKAFLWVNENTSPLGNGDSMESDYYVIAMSRANRTFDYNKYKKITKSRTPETLGDAHRIIIANAACDGFFNETFVGDYTYNLKLNTTSELSGALLALFSGEYEVKSESVTIDDLIVKLLSNQSADGSFGGDIVTTCESIMALSFAEGNRYEAQGEYKTETYYYDVNNSILRAVNYLQGAKGEDCGFEDIKKTANVIMALDSAGVDCDNDPGFVRDGKSTFAWLMSRQNEDGSFGTDTDDTAMAVCAVVSHMRAMQGKENFFKVRSNDKIDSPDIYTEEINLSGTGLKTYEDTQTIKVMLKPDTQETETSTVEPWNSVIDNEIRDIEKNMKKAEKSKATSVIFVAAATTVIFIAILCFVFWRIGILPGIMKRYTRKRVKNEDEDN